MTSSNEREFLREIRRDLDSLAEKMKRARDMGYDIGWDNVSSITGTVVGFRVTALTPVDIDKEPN